MSIRIRMDETTKRDSDAQGNEQSNEKIYSEQLRQVVEALPLSLITILVNGAILAAIAWGEIGHQLIIAWYLMVIAICILRYYWYRQYLAASDKEREPLLWNNRFFFGTVLSGIIWGTAGYLLFSTENHVHQVFLAFIIAGMVAGAITTLAAVNFYFQTFALLAVLPLCLRLIQHGDTISYTMAAMSLFFLIMVSISALRVHRTITTSLHLHDERNRSDEARADADEQNRLLLESAAEGIFGVDINGITTFVNPAAARTLGYEAEELIGRSMHSVIHHHRKNGELYPVAECPMHDTLLHGHNHCVEDEVLWHKDGHAIPVEYNATPILKNGVITGAVISFSDISRRSEAESKLAYQAFFDHLTGLANRRLLLDRTEQAIATAVRHGHLGALLFIDLDHFKHINDSLGHPVGDDLLCNVAARLKQAVRSEDTVARMGGDEFAILLPEIEHDMDDAAQYAQELADTCRLHIAEPYRLLGHELHITASIGIALFPMGAEGADELMRQGDTAMYRAKEAGRDSSRFFLPTMQHIAEERLALYNDLHRALSREELLLFYQPQYDAAGKMIGAEALLRWNHPQRGMIAPDEFIPFIEESALIMPIGEWVLLSACQLVHRLDGQGVILPHIAVNVSPRQFLNPGFVDGLKEILQKSGLDPWRLELEITEGVFVDDIEDTVAKMEILQQIGIRFAIDDFGTGYSSLSYLHRLPLHKLKIDQSFVRSLGTNAGSSVLVDTIIAMGRHLNLKVIAEGVETEQQLQQLRKFGCDYYQGYYFNRPLTEQQLTELRAVGVSSPHC